MFLTTSIRIDTDNTKQNGAPFRSRARALALLCYVLLHSIGKLALKLTEYHQTRIRCTPALMSYIAITQRLHNDILIKLKNEAYISKVHSTASPGRICL